MELLKVDKSLSGLWIGVTRFALLSLHSSRWYKWVHDQLTKKEVYNKTWEHLAGNIVKYVKK